ncbi:MAG: rhodanese-like domain-containing protein [Hyphomicrobiaceae bacterium]|nr:MAG: rhodanese-like domain-containing protein [Hyphomicrobiaceae bacterium]
MGADAGHVSDLEVSEVWRRLEGDKSARLIDVRTRAEWSFVGVPDVSKLGRRPIMVEWQGFPENRVDPAFALKLIQELDAAGVGKDAELFFICRSGGRSLLAARAMQAAGYTRCRNVADGFEGPLDGNRHRGAVAGWKAAGLPWIQA